MKTFAHRQRVIVRMATRKHPDRVPLAGWIIKRWPFGLTDQMGHYLVATESRGTDISSEGPVSGGGRLVVIARADELIDATDDTIEPPNDLREIEARTPNYHRFEDSK